MAKPITIKIEITKEQLQIIKINFKKTREMLEESASNLYDSFAKLGEVFKKSAVDLALMDPKNIKHTIKDFDQEQLDYMIKELKTYRNISIQDFRILKRAIDTELKKYQ